MIDAIIYNLRTMLSYLNINEGYPVSTLVEMLSISDEVANIVINELDSYFDVDFIYDTQMIIRKA